MATALRVRPMLEDRAATAWQAASRDHRAATVAGLLATAFGVAYLAAPLVGQDLAAQLERADFAGRHPFTPINLNWLGGSLTFGYSLWSPLLMAWVGVRLTGALCCVIATVQTTVLFERAGARRPLLGGVLAAVSQAFNLVAGRMTFSVGMVCGLAALLVISRPRPRTARLWQIGVLALLAGAASPVAGLFLWVCAGALALDGAVRPAITLVVASAAPIAVMSTVFGDGGAEPFTASAAVTAVLATLALLAVPASHRALRLGALFGVVLLLGAYLIHSPVGNNATRLSLLFAVPIAAAFIEWRRSLTALVVIAALVPQQIGLPDAFAAGPPASPGYWSPLVTAVHRLGPITGRIEIPQIVGQWDAVFVARALPLARGCIRQVDIQLNGTVFYQGPPTPARYRVWLRDNAVQYVALPDAELTTAGVNEVVTIRLHPAYLRPVWHDKHWVLYAVSAAPPVVSPPGTLLANDDSELRLSAPAHAIVTVDLRWFRWLSLRTTDPKACIESDGAGHVRLRTAAGGTYRLGSALSPSGHC